MKLSHFLIAALAAFFLPMMAMAAATDDYAGFSQGLDSPYRHASAISASDSVELSNVTRAIYVGTGGSVNMISVEGETVLMSAVPQGTVLRVRAKQVKLTSTTASNLVALW